MKKFKILVAAIVAFFSGNAMAQTLTADNINIAPGNSANLVLKYSANAKAAAGQFDIKFPAGVTSNDPVAQSLIAKGFNIKLAKKAADGTLTYFIYSPTGDLFAENSGDLLSFPISVSAEAENGTLDVEISNVKFVNYDASSVGTVTATNPEIVVGYDELGHLVSDPSEAINVEDILKLAKLITEVDETTDELKARGDMNKDGALDANDFVSLTNKVFTSTRAKSNFTPNTVGENILNAKGGQSIVLNLQNIYEFQAAQFDLTLPEGVDMGDIALASRANGLEVFSNKIQGNTWRVLIGAIDGTTIADNAGDLLQIALNGNGAGEATIDNILFSDVNAKGTTFTNMTFNVMAGSVNGINGIEADTNDDANKSIYSVGGASRKSLQRGVNIVRDAAGKVTKVIKR